MVLASDETSTISVRAPAKLNLYLHVTGQRADGYHLLDSLVVFTSSGDTVSVKAAGIGAGLSLVSDGPFAEQMGDDQDNLVWQAALLMIENSGIKNPDVEIHLTKRLPVAAGIGGGSSDAAATMLALDRYWSLDLGLEALCNLGLHLGADVPMCLHRTPSFVGGIGEDITPAPDLPDLAILLINPGVAVSTPDVFKARPTGFTPTDRFLETPKTVQELAALLKTRKNDLYTPALGIAPVIGDVVDALGSQKDCLLARMSGSGATCFGLFANSEQAEQARKTLQTAYPAWWMSTMLTF